MPKTHEFKAKIRKNTRIAKDIYEMVLKAPAALPFVPGQFANISVGSDALLLKRPISINAYNAQNGDMTLIYKVVGKGTTNLSQMHADADLDVLAPLGSGFSVKEKYKQIFLIGGGIGCAPLNSVMHAYPDRDYQVFLGFDTKVSIYQKKELSTKATRLSVATEDGSAGTKGFVTAPLTAALKHSIPDAVFACGPTPMLKAMQDVFKDVDCDKFVSVEERMGCGMGGCAVCVCKTTAGYKKACVAGPVFNLNEVVFD